MINIHIKQKKVNWLAAKEGEYTVTLGGKRWPARLQSLDHPCNNQHYTSRVWSADCILSG
jgi:hypothetical protein